MAKSDMGADELFARDLFSLSEIFHENTKMRRTREGGVYAVQHPGPRSSEDLQYAITHSYKSYHSAKKLPLTKNLPELTESLEQVIRTRRSNREYSGTAVSLDSLSRILELSYGVTGKALCEDGATPFYKRAAPSAGALYSNEVYVVVLNVEGLEPGLYHYQPKYHSLEWLSAAHLRDDLQEAVLYPYVISSASFVLELAAVFQRTRFKYGERGYRFALLDSGHLAQNIYLVATALGLGSVAMAGFLDDEINEMLALNGVDEAVVYLMAVGQLAFPEPGN
jgi:SagB-type dehydrogenase family enzyme